MQQLQSVSVTQEPGEGAGQEAKVCQASRVAPRLKLRLKEAYYVGFLGLFGSKIQLWFFFG